MAEGQDIPKQGKTISLKPNNLKITVLLLFYRLATMSCRNIFRVIVGGRNCLRVRQFSSREHLVNATCETCLCIKGEKLVA